MRPANILYAIMLLLQLITMRVSAGTQFSSHVSISSPSSSFAHGVGDPISTYGRRSLQRQAQRSYRRLRRPVDSSQSNQGEGYTLQKPSVPFLNEEAHHIKSSNSLQWAQNNLEVPIPLLPASPYRVDTDNPESLWPEGLFVPPQRPPRFENTLNRRVDTGEGIMDPYLLEGSEAIAAVMKANNFGQVYFEEFPHIKSLLANQHLRTKNNLRPHRIASIRHSWPFNRP